jgi:hypothetical protein
MAERLPIEPLQQAVRAKSLREFLAACDINHRRYKQMLERGLSIKTADTVATRCGFHPAEVWPQWLYVLAAC